jgi:hypothetical protein
MVIPFLPLGRQSNTTRDLLSPAKKPATGTFALSEKDGPINFIANLLGMDGGFDKLNPNEQEDVRNSQLAQTLIAGLLFGPAGALAGLGNSFDLGQRAAAQKTGNRIAGGDFEAANALASEQGAQANSLFDSFATDFGFGPDNSDNSTSDAFGATITDTEFDRMRESLADSQQEEIDRLEADGATRTEIIRRMQEIIQANREEE